MRSSHDLPSKAMKRPNSTTLRHYAGFMKAVNIEKELKKIRKEFAWVRTEQREMACWIHSLGLKDLDSLPRFAFSRRVYRDVTKPQ
jgi:hypothetical protein